MTDYVILNNTCAETDQLGWAKGQIFKLSEHWSGTTRVLILGSRHYLFSVEERNKEGKLCWVVLPKAEDGIKIGWLKRVAMGWSGSCTKDKYYPIQSVILDAGKVSFYCIADDDGDFVKVHAEDTTCTPPFWEFYEHPEFAVRGEVKISAHTIQVDVTKAIKNYKDYNPCAEIPLSDPISNSIQMKKQRGKKMKPAIKANKIVFLYDNGKPYVAKQVFDWVEKTDMVGRNVFEYASKKGSFHVMMEDVAAIAITHTNTHAQEMGLVENDKEEYTEIKTFKKGAVLNLDVALYMNPTKITKRPAAKKKNVAIKAEKFVSVVAEATSTKVAKPKVTAKRKPKAVSKVKSKK